MIIHEEKAAYDSWVRLVFVLPLGLLLWGAVSAGKQDFEASTVLLGEAILLTLIFYFIMPRKFQIYEDRLRIVLGAPLAINIALGTIREVRHSSGFKAFVYAGVRLATSTGYVLEVVRRRGLNYIISPQNGEVFRDMLNQAIEENKANAGTARQTTG